MKKELLFLCLTMLFQSLNGQTAIPNSGFENWSHASFERPLGYHHTSNMQQHYDEQPYNLFKTSDAYHGQWALKLQTLGENFAYILNTEPDSQNPATWTNGVAFTGKPTGIRFYYKYNIGAVDSALVMLLFRKNGQMIGSEFIRFGGVKNSYTLFDYDFESVLTETPDSLIFGFVSSDFRFEDDAIDGATLFVDSISLKGVVEQPALLNLDFEHWDNYQSPPYLLGWPNAKHNDGIEQTTDAKAGNFALKLLSYQGVERSGENFEIVTPRVWPGSVSTGWWEEDCECQVGGMPYTLAVDTITFWYKYAPVLNDEAELWLNFRKNGQTIAHRAHRLQAASTYTYVSYAFDIGQVPDSLILQFQSSLWSNSALSYAGSTLIVDELYLKSELVPNQVLTLNVDGIVYGPNPVVDKLNFTENAIVKAVFNSTGKRIQLMSDENYIDFSNVSSGIYFVIFEKEGKSSSYRIIKY